ncbi:unnamed protein product [Brachionus calyciflorus]|uniref:Fanconi anemia group D2 protein n=1 Tax=Brachionus calyciflorus TaxID=104777 RepID=A0A813NQ99_9BILA|nr:unnamed protein product [Brachionus calyciflorus]
MSKNASLVEIFKKFGFILNNGEETFNSLNVDPRKFQSNVTDFIQKSSDNPQWEKNLKSIQQNLENYLEDETNFMIALLPSKNSSDQQTHSSNQDNLLKILLEIPEIQTDLFEFLITKILTYLETSENNGDAQILGIDINIPSYIIAQFRYQPKINDPQLMCQKLIELINNTSNLSIKKEIIACFPDILCDSQHDGLVSDLELLLDETELISVTLDTLSNLKFKNENLLRISRNILVKFSLLNENDFPSCVKFILKALINLNDKDVLNDLRSKLKLEELNDNSIKYLIYDLFKENFQVSSQLIDLYSTCIQYNTLSYATNLILPLDFLIVALIYSSPQHVKQMDKLFKLALKQETLKNLEKSCETFISFSKNFGNELLDSLQIMSKSLIQNPPSDLANIGQIIIKNEFLIYEKKNRQELLNFLLELIINYNGPLRDNSLDILVSLSSNKNENVLASFQTQIKTLLDYIEYFNLSEIRKVYLIICSVAYSHPKPAAPNSISVISSSQSFCKPNSIQDSLNILINKQLSSNCLKYKQIGVIGALMLIKYMAIRTKNNNQETEKADEGNESFFSCSSSQSSIYNAPGNSTSIQNSSYILSSISNEIKNIWDMILDSSRSSPESLGLFEDDLTGIIIKESIGESLEILMKENLKEMSKNLFKLDPSYKQSLTKYGQQLSSFRFGYEFGIDERTVGALNLLPLILNDMQKKNATLLNPLTITPTLPSIAVPSTFRLMCALERKNLKEFADYLGCPILCINKDDLLKYGSEWIHRFKSLNEDEKKLLCNTIFYLINWFIELINAFSSKILDDEFPIGDKLINRLSYVCDLRNVLSNVLPYMKFYRPPMVVFGLIDSSIDELPYVHQFVKEPKSKSGKRKGIKEGKKAIKKPKNEDIFENSDIEEEKTILDDSEDEQEISSEFDLNKISIYFREFDISLINFVNFDLNLNPNIIPDSSERGPVTCSLKPEHLIYILNDFNLKFSLILKSNTVKTSPLGIQSSKPSKLQLFLEANPIEVSSVIEQLSQNNIPFLVKHLDDIQNHIRSIQEKNDGIKDPSEISNNKNNLLLLQIANQILKILHSIFHYLNSINNHKQLESLFKIILKSVKIQATSKMATQVDKLPDLVCFNYLAKLKDVLLDLNSGFILVQLLDLLIKILSKKTDGSLLEKMKKILSNCSSEFLLNDYNLKLNSIFSTRQLSNEAITSFLNCLIANSEDSLKVVDDIVKVISSEDFMLDRQNCDKFSTLKNHFLAYYKVCIEYTVNELKFCSGDTLEMFSKIRCLAQMHSELVLMKKSVAFKDINILTVIKNSKLFITNFSKYSMPCLDKAFDNSKQEVVALLQMIQKSVHFIQEILVTKDQSAIAKQAPLYNRTIEALMVRVQQLLYVNSFDGEFNVNFVGSKLKIGDDGKKKREKKEKKPIKKNSKKDKRNDSEIESEVEDDDEKSENDDEDSDTNDE